MNERTDWGDMLRYPPPRENATERHGGR
jgi:hypothetical protein